MQSLLLALLDSHLENREDSLSWESETYLLWKVWWIPSKQIAFLLQLFVFISAIVSSFSIMHVIQSRKQRMHTHIIVHLYFCNTGFSLGHGLLIHDHLGAMLIAYDLTGGAEVEWDADQTLPRERGLEILNSPAAVLSIGDCSWSSVSSLMLVAVLYCCSHCGTTGGSFHNGGYSNCLLLKKTAPQWHPRLTCSSPRR